MRDGQTCGTCQFFDSRGECHKDPPRMLGKSTSGQWPIVNIDEWCGEWKEHRQPQGFTGPADGSSITPFYEPR